MKPYSTTLLKSALLMSTLLACQAIFADELVVAVGHQGADKASLARPNTGMTDKKVEATFGAPIKKYAPVGKPPISKWEYPEYWVYFESDRVINAVLKPMPTETEPTAPVPAAVTPSVPAVQTTATEPATPPAKPEPIAPVVEPAVAEPAATDPTTYPTTAPTPETVTDPAPVTEPTSAVTADSAKEPQTDDKDNVDEPADEASEKEEKPAK